MKLSLFRIGFGAIHAKTRLMLLMFGLIMILVAGINYAFMIYSQAKIIEHEALRIAEVATAQALTSRSVYSQAIADKLLQDGYGSDADFHQHKGFIPLPVQFLKLVGQASVIDGNGLYQYFPISKWNLDSSQGLQDDFQKEAWRHLEQQEESFSGVPVAWKPYWQFEKINGVRTLRYLRADPAAAATCVACHNEYEQHPEIISRRIRAGIRPGKQWQQHQLMGAIEARIPMDKVEIIASNQAQLTLAVALLTSLTGLVIAAGIALRDVKREQRATAFFAAQSKFDPLTQLGNRSLFNERGEAALYRAKRNHTCMALLYIDLDAFKLINDQYGHHVGDVVLQESSRRLVQILRVTDLVVRMGGDEFLVLLEAVPLPQHLGRLAAKLLDELSQPIQHQQLSLRIFASIGICCYPDHGTTLPQLVEHADAAMYIAKRNGKHSYQVWQEEY